MDSAEQATTATKSIPYEKTPVNPAAPGVYEAPQAFTGRTVLAPGDLWPDLPREEQEAKIRALSERFWRQVERRDSIRYPGSEGCWEWRGGTNGQGYGQLRRVAGRKVYAHRLSYMLNVGPIPEGAMIRHRCNNPLCVNPDHLQPGTDAENMADALKADPRAFRVKTSPAERREIGERYAAGGVTQRELAEEHGVSVARVNQIVRGRHEQTPGGN